MRPKAYVQRTSSTLEQSDIDFGNLLPEKRSTFVIKSGHDKLYGTPEGVSVAIDGPTAHPRWQAVHKDAPYEEQGTLFGYERPQIDILYAHGSGKSHVAAALGLAHKESLERFGAVPTHSPDLTPYSMNVVRSAIKKGLVEEHPDITNYDYNKVSNANPVELQDAKDAARKSVGSAIRRAQGDALYAKEAHQKNESKHISPNLFREMPMDTVHKARKYAKNLLRPPVEAAVDHPQFDQLSLFPT
jgi:hypothetical protein